MVFNGGMVTTVIWIVLIIWISIITFFLLRMIRHYNRLTRDTSAKGLKEVLEEILAAQKIFVTNSDTLQEEIVRLKKEGTLHIQKIGLERFNPFSDTGGSQSFTLAILDGNDNGLVMTSLYARTGNRWYVKEVRGGKGKEFELSKEELNALHKAQTIKGKIK
jgi:hypothetical protein